MQIARTGLVLVLMLTAFASVAEAKGPADKFKGKIILSTKAFPTSFKSDAAFIKHMKRAETKGFRYEGKAEINVEFMAFFARPYANTEFTVTIYDMTEGRTLVYSFPVYPGQKNTRILASGTSLDKATFAEERSYLMVVTPSYNGPIIAETTFSIKADPNAPKPEVKPEVHTF